MDHSRPLGRKYSAYAEQGYSQEVRKALSEMKLPQMVRCIICKKWCSTNYDFSKTQLSRLRHYAFVNGVGAVYGRELAKCRTCANTSINELKCSKCEHWNSIDEFSVNQRGLLDPICMQCQTFFQDPHVLRSDNQNEHFTKHLTQGNWKALPDPDLVVHDSVESEHALSVNAEPDEEPWLDDDGRPIMVKRGDECEAEPLRAPTKETRHLYGLPDGQPSRRFGRKIKRAVTPPESRNYPKPPRTPPTPDPADERSASLEMQTWEYL